MKNFLIIFMILMLFLLAFVYKKNSFSWVEDSPSVVKRTLFLDKSKAPVANNLGADDLGFAYSISVDEASYNILSKYLSGIIGKSITLNQKQNFVNVIFENLSAIVVGRENVHGTQVYYGFSRYLGDCIAAKAFCFNVQVAVTKNLIVVGCPVIYGDF